MSTLRSDTPRQSKAEEVKRLYESGLSPREIAKVLDMSTQGVHWHLKRLREAGRLEQAS